MAEPTTQAIGIAAIVSEVLALVSTPIWGRLLDDFNHLLAWWCLVTGAIYGTIKLYREIRARRTKT